MTYVMFLCLLNSVPEQAPVFTKVSQFDIHFPTAVALVALGFRKQASLKPKDTYHWLVLLFVCSKEV